MINFFIQFSILFASASGGGGHHEEGVPSVVLYQAINLAIFVGILVWFGKDKVREVFKNRLAEFHRLAQETEKARKDLEFKKEDLVRRSEQLRKTSQQSLADAKQEAEKYYLDEIEKSKKQALKIEKDVETQLLAEELKLVEKLRIEVLEMSVTEAERQMVSLESSTKEKITKSAQQRIEGAMI